MKIRGTFCERTLAPKSRFAKKSFRWVKRGSNWLLVGCPKGKWTRRSRCKVGTRAHKLLVKARGRCRVGKRIKKG
jgi:hypothetical protein